MDVRVFTSVSEGGEPVRCTFLTYSLYLVVLNSSLGKARPIRRNDARRSPSSRRRRRRHNPKFF